MEIEERKSRLRKKLDTARRELLDVLAQVQPDDEARSTENPAWTVHDLVVHLAVAEVGLQGTVKRFLAGTVLPVDFDLNTWNERMVKRAQNRPLADLLTGLETSRAQTFELIDALTAAELDVEGVHPAGIDTTVEGIFKIMAYHERLHAAEIARAMGLAAPHVRPWPG